MSTTDEVKGALERRGARRAAGSIYDELDLHGASLAEKVPTGTITYGYALAALKTALRDEPKLQTADPARVLGAWAHTLMLGLPLGMDLAYLVPFGSQVVPIVGYRGYVQLGYRSKLLRSLNAWLVYEGEPFRELGGTRPGIRHEILEPRKGAEIVASYAVANLTTGGKVWRVIREADWETARKASQLGKENKGPWADHRAAMIRKTAIRRVAPLLPLVPELGEALRVDDQPAEPYGADEHLEALERSAAEAPDSNGP